MATHNTAKTIREKINGLKEELFAKEAEVKKLITVEAAFPDATININRWGTVRIESAAANEICTNYDLSHNCGCCNDSPLELWPYTTFYTDPKTDINIYAKGIPFRIGENNYGNGERPYGGWEQTLREAKISEDIITRITKYFEDHKPQLEDDGWDEDDMHYKP